jgi:hypothetical protein
MTRRLLRRHNGQDSDRGSISLYFAITAELATQAARAGATALTPTSLRGSPAQLAADPATATQAAQAILTDGGATGQVTVSGDTVTVTAHLPRRTVILSAVGLTNISQTATASATALVGTATGPEGD